MKLFVIPNVMTKEQIEITKKVINLLIYKLDATVSLTKDNSLLVFGNEEFSSFKAKESDYIISIGGDACVLSAARKAIELNKPLIGINAGRVGYLCAYELSDLDNLTKDSFKLLKKTNRPLLNIKIGDNNYFAINDLIIGKSNFGKTIEINVTLDNRKLANFLGDGIIVSSPTGSTAYNQSAGGPELRYDSPSFVITPICPHLSKFKPTVVSNDSLILISSKVRPENVPMIYIDGTIIKELDGTIEVSKYSKELILCIQ